MKALESINNKLDKLIESQANINKMLAVHDLKHTQKDDKINDLEKTAAQYKADRYRLMGGSGVLAALISYFVKH